jgi:hypothetical protein
MPDPNEQNPNPNDAALLADVPTLKPAVADALMDTTAAEVMADPHAVVAKLDVAAAAQPDGVTGVDNEPKPAALLPPFFVRANELAASGLDQSAVLDKLVEETGLPRETVQAALAAGPITWGDALATAGLAQAQPTGILDSAQAACVNAYRTAEQGYVKEGEPVPAEGVPPAPGE